MPTKKAPDGGPGITRLRRGKSFTYKTAKGATLTDEKHLARIKALAIPPAWTDVWISPTEKSPVQATGRDARKRKQYRYHAGHRKMQEASKYESVLSFAEALPKIRRRVAADLRRKGLPKEKVVAAVVRLLETTLIRVGNDEYARTNQSYGLSTMQDKHAKFKSSEIHFRFRGKSGVFHEVSVKDKKLAKIVKECQDLPGQELFQYLDDKDAVRDIKSGDINDYLRNVSGGSFSAKDFRTFAGTVLAAMALQEYSEFDTKVQAKRNILRAIEQVAKRLGNTASVCRSSYVHPVILDSYLDGSLLETLNTRTRDSLSGGLKGYSSEEAAVLAFLRVRLDRETKARRRA